ncbi:MAG: C4-dicarboxylate transporter DcuC [Planctomycetes bacterium]|nr:C4-dicarboxylate transporter DcuC [Planctomycetota bacterium]
MEFAGFAALTVIVLAVWMVVKGWDVRLVLLVSSLLIAAGASVSAQPGHQHDAVAGVLRTFLATFSNEKFVVPICSAMGFAYVLRHTGCERHLVLLLVKPLRYVRWLLVPGVLLVGFLVNIPVISQTSTAVCIGPVIVPLMRAARYSMATIGACLLLGASVGGELLNPGAPELLTVAAATGVSTIEQTHRYIPKLVFTQLAVSMLVFWVMSIWWERKANSEDPSPNPLPQGERGQNPAPPSFLGKGDGGLGSSEPPERINLLKAFVPLVPLMLLFASGMPEGYKLFDIPDEWVILPKDGKRDTAYSSRLIGLAMLVGVLAAAAVTPSKSRDCVKQFFDGAGYGFANVVSLIVIATCFGNAIEAAGLAKALGLLITGTPELMQPLAGFVPLSFATISGSGMASTQSLYGFFYQPALDLKLDPVDVGALVSLGSAAGRTMSPVAAVTLMCGTLTGTNPFTLAKRVAVPLLVGMIVVVVLRIAGVL